MSESEFRKTLEGLRRGEDKAYEWLFSTYGRDMHRSVVRRFGQHGAEVAQDAVQRAVMVVFNRVNKGTLPDFQCADKFRRWLRVITKRRAIDLLRRRKPHIPLLKDLKASALATNAAQNALEADEFAKRVVDLLGILTPREREVFLLHAVKGLEPQAIADELGIREPTARQRLHRARDRLRDALGLEAPSGAKNSCPSVNTTEPIPPDAANVERKERCNDHAR